METMTTLTFSRCDESHSRQELAHQFETSPVESAAAEVFDSRTIKWHQLVSSPKMFSQRSLFLCTHPGHQRRYMDVKSDSYLSIFKRGKKVQFSCMGGIFSNVIKCKFAKFWSDFHSLELNMSSTLYFHGFHEQTRKHLGHSSPALDEWTGCGVKINCSKCQEDLIFSQLKHEKSVAYI